MEIVIAFVSLAIVCGIGRFLIRRQKAIQAVPIKRGSLARNNDSFARIFRKPPRHR
jgi:hypothetical protein